MKALNTILLIGILLITGHVNGQGWQLQEAPLMTDYAYDVDPDNVLPEYPRPQMIREDWLNLNGVWQFQPATAGETLPTGDLSRTILVPFAVESAISGVMEHHERLWYRRTFQVPAEWDGKELILHFGAVDYEAEVFINGTSIGDHFGGYDPFEFNITPYLIPGQDQEITIRVSDPTDSKGFPRGKQTWYPGGIMYTSVTGIWQTVWIEPVNDTHIEDIDIVPDIDNSILNLRVNTAGTDISNTSVEVKVFDAETLVNTVNGDVNTNLQIRIPNQKLWSPNDPFLYDMQIKLTQNEALKDSIGSYFGMRKVSYERIGDFGYAYLNNEHLFQMGPLDQGYWPDGLYTAPTDEALKYDIQVTKDLGYNMSRKHVKIEPARWYYWADKIGILVWQDMPSTNSYINTHERPNIPPIEKEAFESELVRMVETLKNYPSIAMWVIFNESQGQFDTHRLTDLIMTMDTTRLVSQASGGYDYGISHVLDDHHYPEPVSPSTQNADGRIKVCGEFGGIAYNIDGHTFPGGFGYTYVNSAEGLLSLYQEYMMSTALLAANEELNAAVYTEITDVETEINGLMTYDRKIIKADVAEFNRIHTDLINKELFYTDVLPPSLDTAIFWQYTTSLPAASWYYPDYDDATWSTVPAGFGTYGTPGANVRTVWNTGNIWLRKKFFVGDLSEVDMDKFYFWIHHDEDVTIYINGNMVASFGGYTSNYKLQALSSKAQNALISNSENTIAVHCQQTFGGQYIDIGITMVNYGSAIPPLDDGTTFDDENMQGNATITVYPNPASDYLFITGNNDKPISVSVTNISGIEVISKNDVGEKLNIESLPTGIYFIKVKSGLETYSTRILKE